MTQPNSKPGRPRKAAVSTDVQSQDAQDASSSSAPASSEERPKHGKPVQFGGDPYGDTPMQSRPQ